MKFYMTYSRDAPSRVVPWVESNNVPIMTSAMTRLSADGSLNDLWDYDTDHIVDSGGYSVLARAENHGTSPEYPWAVETYHNWLCEHSDEFEWAAVMDYACERRFDHILSVEERVDLTVENTIKHFDLLNGEYELMPVIQGRLLHEYKDCWRRLDDAGIPVDRVGLGTVCRIESSPKIVWMEKKLREETGIEWMHGFGVKITAYKNGATFESSDSAAWSVPLSFGMKYATDGDGIVTKKTDEGTNKRTHDSFKNYYNYVQGLMDERKREVDGKLLNPRTNDTTRR